MQVMLIALGGALGSVLRYLIGLWLVRPGEGFPVGTLVINVTGCVAIGVLVPLLKAWHVREDFQLMVLVGVLGGYTTFSTFGRETVALIEGQRYGMAAGYVVLSNGLGILGVWVGMVGVRALVGRV
jgi:CrcB protein